MFLESQERACHISQASWLLSTFKTIENTKKYNVESHVQSLVKIFYIVLKSFKRWQLKFKKVFTKVMELNSTSSQPHISLFTLASILFEKLRQRVEHN